MHFDVKFPSRFVCSFAYTFPLTLTIALAGSWNPAWSCASILTGLLSFMLSEEITTGACGPFRVNDATLISFSSFCLGSTRATDAERKALAATSHAWNLYVFYRTSVFNILSQACIQYSFSTNAKFKAILSEFAVTPMKALPNMGPPETPPSKDKITVLANSSTSIQTNPDGDAPVGNGIGKRNEGGWFISRWRREVTGGVILLLISWALMRVLEL